jgi:hypothetical protein
MTVSSNYLLSLLDSSLQLQNLQLLQQIQVGEDMFVYEQQVRIELWKFGAYITLRMCECGALSTEA